MKKSSVFFIGMLFVLNSEAAEVKNLKTNFSDFNRATIPDGGFDVIHMKQLFSDDQKLSAERNNDKIPLKKPNTLRVATFNGGFNKPLSETLEKVKSLDVDILFIQEVKAPGGKITIPADSGFAYSQHCADLESIANVFLSKVEINKDAIIYDEHKNRCAIHIEINVPVLGKIDIIGTHLDAFKTNADRIKLIEKIGESVILPWGAQASNGLIFLGDMNALRKAEISPERWNFITASDQKRRSNTATDEIPLIESYGMVDSFVALGTDAPKSTCWSGRRVDYIFTHEKSDIQPIGCHTFHLPRADHVPLIGDFNIRNK